MSLLFITIAALSGTAHAGPGPTPPPRVEPRIVWTRSSLSPEAGIVLGGETDATVAVFEGCALGTIGPAEVHAIEVDNCLAWGGHSLACARYEGYWGSDAPIAMLSFDYWSTDGSIQSADGELVDGVVVFDGLTMWVPPCHSGTMLLPIVVDHNEADPAGAVPGDAYMLNLVSNRWSGFEAVEYRTGRAITRATPIVDSAVQVFHDTVPTFSLHSASPSGDTIPGLSESLRMVVATNASGYYYEQTSQAFEVVATDNAGSGWNTCGQLASAVWEFDVLDSDGTFYDLGAIWDFYAWDGTPCTDAPDAELGYAVANALYGLGAAWTDILSVWLDSTGASATADDSIRLRAMTQADAELVGIDALVWTDGPYDGEFDGTYVDTEVDGNTLNF